MLTFYPHKGLVEDPYPTFPGRVVRATREEIENQWRFPTPRRYGVVMGWLDPLTMAPYIAVCDQDLVNLLVEARLTGFEAWQTPELLAPIFAKCPDKELRRALELALLRAKNGCPAGPVKDGRVNDAL